MTVFAEPRTSYQLVYDLIGTHASLEVLLGAVTCQLEDQLPETLVSVMTFSEQSQCLRFAAGDRFSEPFRRAMRLVPVGRQVCTCSAAASSRALVMSESIQEDPRWSVLPKLLEAVQTERLASCWSIPVIEASGRILGTLAVYSRIQQLPNQAQIALMRKAASVAAMVIANQAVRSRSIDTEERFRSLFTRHPEAVLELDVDGRFVDCNRAVEAVLDLSVGELRGRHFTEFSTEAHVTRLCDAFHLALQGKPQTFETESFNGKGGEYHLDVTLLPIMICEQVVGVYGICRDVTAVKRKDDQLRMLQRGFDASPNGVVMADAKAHDFPVVYSNPGFSSMTGYSQEEVLGKNCRLLQGPDTCPDGVAAVRGALTANKEIQVTLRNYRKDGSAFWNQLSLAPVFDLKGVCTHYVSIQRDVTQQRENEDLLRHHASHDMVTGLANHQTFDAQLSQEYARAHKAKLPLAVLFIDLDAFRPLIENLGRGPCDHLLAMVADRLRSVLSIGDTVARLSSDEFAMLLPQRQREHEVIEVVERVLTEVAKPYILGDYSVLLTASVGIAFSGPEITQSSLLLHRANKAMQEAKRQGGNIWQRYAEAEKGAEIEFSALRGELRDAIEQDQLVLHYQPIVDAQHENPVTVEALVRWCHPERGMVSPGHFIPLAEQTGQIVDIGRWVLRRACHDIARWCRETGQHLEVAVNISPLQFRRRGFLEELRSALTDSGLAPAQLELEITEGVLMSGAEAAIDTLSAVRNLGVKVAIDDFGTGFSSLSYLRELPITKVKLDRSFIKDIADNKKNAAIVRCVVKMAHHLGLVVVAEGIETILEKEHLASKQCDLLQGFLFSRPLPLKQLTLLDVFSAPDANSPEESQSIPGQSGLRSVVG